MTIRKTSLIILLIFIALLVAGSLTTPPVELPWWYGSEAVRERLAVVFIVAVPVCLIGLAYMGWAERRMAKIVKRLRGE